MAKDKLVVVEPQNANDDKWRLQWYLPDEGDMGSYCGVRGYSENDCSMASGDDHEYTVSENTGAKTPSVARDADGYHWPSKKLAAAALALIKIAMKDKSGRPWPEWALRARAEGWTPPKGWTP